MIYTQYIIKKSKITAWNTFKNIYFRFWDYVMIPYFLCPFFSFKTFNNTSPCFLSNSWPLYSLIIVVCVYIYIHIHVYICVYIYNDVAIYVCVYIYTYTCVYMCIYIYSKPLYINTTYPVSCLYKWWIIPVLIVFVIS